MAVARSLPTSDRPATQTQCVADLKHIGRQKDSPHFISVGSSLQCGLLLQKDPYVSLCRDDFCQRIFVVPGAASDRPIHSAMVWRRAIHLDKLHAVLSDSAAGRIPVCASDQHQSQTSNAGDDSFESSDRVAVLSSDLADRFLEAGIGPVAIIADPAAAAGNGRWPLLHAVVDRAVDAKVVQPCIAWKVALSPVRFVKYRFTSGFAELSVRL